MLLCPIKWHPFVSLPLDDSAMSITTLVSSPFDLVLLCLKVIVLGMKELCCNMSNSCLTPCDGNPTAGHFD
jgi:hypothetical protein